MMEARREGRRQNTSKRPNESGIGRKRTSEESKNHASKRLNECVRKEAVVRESGCIGVKLMIKHKMASAVPVA